MAQNESIHFEVILPDKYLEEMIIHLRTQIKRDQATIQRFKIKGWDLSIIEGTISRCAAACLTLNQFEIAYNDNIE